MKIALHKKNHENFCCILFAVKPICKVAKQISQAFTFGKKYKTCTMGWNPFRSIILITHLLSLCFSKMFLRSRNFYSTWSLFNFKTVLCTIFSWFKARYRGFLPYANFQMFGWCKIWLMRLFPRPKSRIRQEPSVSDFEIF